MADESLRSFSQEAQNAQKAQKQKPSKQKQVRPNGRTCFFRLLASSLLRLFAELLSCAFCVFSLAPLCG